MSSLGKSGTGTAAGLRIREVRPEDLVEVFDLYDRAWEGDFARRRTAFEWLMKGPPFRGGRAGRLLAFKGEALAGDWGRLRPGPGHDGWHATHGNSDGPLVKAARGAGCKGISASRRGTIRRFTLGAPALFAFCLRSESPAQLPLPLDLRPRMGVRLLTQSLPHQRPVALP